MMVAILLDCRKGEFFRRGGVDPLPVLGIKNHISCFQLDWMREGINPSPTLALALTINNQLIIINC